MSYYEVVAQMCGSFYFFEVYMHDFIEGYLES